jgi:hypothetical protein
MFKNLLLGFMRGLGDRAINQGVLVLALPDLQGVSWRKMDDDHI